MLENHLQRTHIGQMKGQVDKGCEMCQRLLAQQAEIQQAPLEVHPPRQKGDKTR